MYGGMRFLQGEWRLWLRNGVEGAGGCIAQWNDSSPQRVFPYKIESPGRDLSPSRGFAVAPANRVDTQPAVHPDRLVTDAMRTARRQHLFLK